MYDSVSQPAFRQPRSECYAIYVAHCSDSWQPYIARIGLKAARRSQSSS